MKKAISLVLTLILAFSCLTMAFAADSYPCPFCDRTFGNETDLKDHKSVCSKNPANSTAKEYTCSTCGQVYTNVDKYNAHLAGHTTTAKAGDTTAVYTCRYCNGRFYTTTAYEDHLKTCELRTNLNGQVMNYFYHDMGVSELFKDLLENVSLDNNRLSILAPIIQRIIDFIENLINNFLLADEAGVEGVSSDLSSIESKLAEWGFDVTGGKIKAILDSIKAKIKALYCGEAATTACEATPETGSSSTGIAVFAAVSVAAAAAYVCTKKKED